MSYRLVPCLIVALLAVAPAQTFGLTTIADYNVNFQGPVPATGWKYQWNSGGVIGNNANYTNLLFAAADNRYDSNGLPGLPDPDPAAFVLLNSTGGHPGRGSAQAGGLDRYAIASFTVTESGDYAITDSFVNSIDLAGNGGDVFIHVNSGGVLGRYFFTANGQNFNFDTFLGALNAGDTIFVGIGPNGADGNDSFAFDFSVTQIFSIPEPASLSLLALAAGALGVRRRSRV